jgi:hypothetical protein
MGGFGSILKDVVKEEAPSFIRSTEHLFSRTTEGKAFVKMMREGYEPEVAKLTQAGISQGFAPDVAKAAAVSNAQATFFGHKNQIPALLIRSARKVSPTYQANVADAIGVIVKERAIPIVNKTTGKTVGTQVPFRRAAADIGANIKQTPYYQTPGEKEMFLKNVASWSYTGRIVLPHLTQPLNTVLVDGISASTKAVFSMMKDGVAKSQQRMLASGALADELLHQYRVTASGAKGLFEKFFHQPGFNYVRKMQITHSALAGEYAARDAATDLVSNATDKRAAEWLKQLGIDPQKVLAQRGLIAEDIEKAQFISAQKAMFIRSELDTPYTWQHNVVSRLAFMYKNYPYNEGRLITNSIRDSFRRSPMDGFKTLAILGTAFPIAGEIIKHVENFVLGSNTDLKDNILPPKVFRDMGFGHDESDYMSEYVDAMSHVAGFGVAYSMVRAAQRHNLGGYMMGPIPSTVMDMTQDALSGNGRKLARSVGYRVPVVGPYVTNKVLPRRKAGRKKDVANPSVPLP